MKIPKFIVLLILITATSCEDSKYQSGLKAINKIENYRKNNHRLPQSLGEIGIEETESSPIYYQLKTDSTYIIWYGLSLGESKTYESATKKWD